MHRKLSVSFIATALLLFAAVATLPQANAAEKDLQIATFAGGCFWCVESDFDNVAGVVRTVSGYTGGNFEKPHLQTGHGRRQRAPRGGADIL